MGYSTDELVEQGRTLDILPALKGEDSNAGQRGGPTVPLATFRLPNGVRRGDTGFVRDPSAPRGVWHIRRPFERGIRLHRASRSSRRDGGDAPSRRFPRVRARAVPSACLPFVPRWAGTIERGSLFACRVATASETPCRERCGSLRRPGGPQSNRQFLPVVLDHGYAVRGLNTGGCGGVVESIPALKHGAFSSHFRKFQCQSPNRVQPTLWHSRRRISGPTEWPDWGIVRSVKRWLCDPPVVPSIAR